MKLRLTLTRAIAGVTCMSVLTAGCAERPSAPVANGHATARTAQPAQIIQAAEANQLLNDVITAWLQVYDRDQRPEDPRVVVMLGNHMPPGFIPTVAGWTFVMASEDDPESPPAQVRAGDTEYLFEYHSSYEAVKQLKLQRAGETPPGPPARTVHVVEPKVLRIDAFRLEGDSGEVEISQNRHHNLGGSGTTFHVQRTAKGWQCTAGMMWMN